MTKNLPITILILLTSLVSGCASIPLASSEEDKQAKLFQVGEGKSNIYLYQTESDEGATPRITLNGKEAGKLGQYTYFLWSVDPGRHLISSLTLELQKTETLAIDTEADKNYFIWQDIVRGSTFGGRVKGIKLRLKEVSSEEGRQGVKASKRVASKI